MNYNLFITVSTSEPISQLQTVHFRTSSNPETVQYTSSHTSSYESYLAVLLYLAMFGMIGVINQSENNFKNK